VPRWEYDKIDLKSVTPKAEDIDILNEVGKDGWELVIIATNHVAYLKRPIAVAAAQQEPAQPTSGRRRAPPRTQQT